MDDLLTEQDVATLNDARALLRRVARRADYYSRRLYEPGATGRLSGYCESAEHAVFMVLNIANAYCKVNLTHEQLHDAALKKIA